MDHSGVSEVLYAGLCYKIGTPEEVRVRREVLIMSEMIQQPLQISQGLRTTDGGSYGEGFRFKSSDRDKMAWSCDHKVLCDMSQSVIHHPSTDTLIFMDTSDTPGGYARLKLLTPSRNLIINSSLASIHNVVYISSFLFRSLWYKKFCGLDPHVQKEILHGPCYSCTVFTTESDFALCFYSPDWPSAALNSINRYNLLQKFLSEGCHLVPIESKQPNDFGDFEWRISFARAERRLVYHMNHVQFLCYGLLKIFLKETIRDDLLSSYFMKTLVFWQLQNNIYIPWAPHTLLRHFWICFKFLVHSVHTGCLPNFFIPENNMFLGKVVGPQQMSLFQKLEKIYTMDVTCLLQSPFLREILIPALSALYLKSNIKSELDIDIALQKEMTLSGLDFICTDFQKIKIYLETIGNLSQFNHRTTFQLNVVDVLIAVGMSLKWKCARRTKNKLYYQINRSIIQMFTLVSKIGFVSDKLHLAMYLYDIGKYKRALVVLDIARQKLSQPFVMYKREVDEQIYCKLMGGQSLSTKMRNAWARDVTIKSCFKYIDEFNLEQRATQKSGVNMFCVPPLVLTHMLSVLCLHRLGNKSLCQQSLTDLQTLLHSDDNKNIPKILREISWQILGICQQVVGELHEALDSYQQAFDQPGALDGLINKGLRSRDMGDICKSLQISFKFVEFVRKFLKISNIQEATRQRMASVRKQMSS
ncbi:uncharacterized protein LOC133185101 [Saccostrea echinata]|uniref:uncharacterized protein LOC133185101 n=1 Tax=Saccostrea echinata TaxID=191078 RepID=UPI002A83AB89|nr:uncharacterized protein LOC133185101 [Saccostrea echinata]